MNTTALTELQKSTDTNVFVMMRYRSARQFSEIEEAIRESLLRFGLKARFAKDAALTDDLWGNIVLYMQHSRFGIAVFEDIDEREFNPNISLELGYMYALKKRCLLLKEERMPRLPTDICGRIYKNFDSYNIACSIGDQIEEWCAKDLGILPRTTDLVETLVFDNQVDDPTYSSWGTFCSDGLHALHFELIHPLQDTSPEESVKAMRMVTTGSEMVGLNKAVPYLRGRVRYEYMAVSSKASNPNLLFCMIPMKGEFKELVELGAEERSDPANAYSPFRERNFVPQTEIGTSRWETASIEFDFTAYYDASYSIFAPRINEGCPRPGSGELLLRNVELFVPESDVDLPPNPAVPPDVFRAARSTSR